MKTCCTVKTIYTHENPDVNKHIRELDLTRRIKLINTIIREIKIKSEKNLEISRLNKTDFFNDLNTNTDIDPVQLCLAYIFETMKEIDRDLTSIENKIKYHKSKWFNNWRTLNIKNEMDNLTISSKMLENRFNDLLKVSQFLVEINN